MTAVASCFNLELFFRELSQVQGAGDVLAYIEHVSCGSMSQSRRSALASARVAKLDGSPAWIRTRDLVVNSDLLYR